MFARCGVGTDAAGGVGLGGPGRRTGLGGVLVRVGDLGAGRSGLAESGGGGDDRSGHTLCGLAACGGSPGGRGGRTGPRAVAGAFEAVQTATVWPFVVAANRNALVQMVASNWFGLNAPAIAQLEGDYEAMWAQDVGAMSGYYCGA